MSAVHDGGEDTKSGTAADSANERGIAVHAVKNVSSTQGWACTQMASEKAPEAESAQKAVLQLQDSQQSAGLPEDVLPHQSIDPADSHDNTLEQQGGATQPASQTGSHALVSQAPETQHKQPSLAPAEIPAEAANEGLTASIAPHPATEVR